MLLVLLHLIVRFGDEATLGLGYDQIIFPE